MFVFGLVIGTISGIAVTIALACCKLSGIVSRDEEALVNNSQDVTKEESE